MKKTWTFNQFSPNLLSSLYCLVLSYLFPLVERNHGDSALSYGLTRCLFQKLKEEADKIQEEYGYCILDGHREKIGNFKTEPPGLFRGRGDHPKMGMLKKRIMPEDVIINCSK